MATAAKPPAAPPAPPVDMMAQLPLKLFGLPGRYASALYVAASKASALKEACSSLRAARAAASHRCQPQVEKELAVVTELAAKSDKFGAFLSDPSGSKVDKLKGLAEIFDAGKFSATTKQFFGARPAEALPANIS